MCVSLFVFLRLLDIVIRPPASQKTSQRNVVVVYMYISSSSSSQVAGWLLMCKVPYFNNAFFLPLSRLPKICALWGVGRKCLLLLFPPLQPPKYFLPFGTPRASLKKKKWKKFFSHHRRRHNQMPPRGGGGGEPPGVGRRLLFLLFPAI